MKETATLGLQAFITDVVQRGGRAVPVADSNRGAVRVWGTGGDSYVVQVRAKAGGNWSASRRDAALNSDAGAQYWAFVDIGSTPRETFIMPAEEIAADIRCEVDAWLAERPGRTPSGHISIAIDRVAHRRARWDLLGISASADTSVAPVELDLDALGYTPPPATKRSVAAVVEEEIDYRLRFVADFEGYRIVALLEESTQQMEIVDGPMQGRRFENPTVAASAVASFVSGDVEKRDGATFWRAEAI